VFLSDNNTNNHGFASLDHKELKKITIGIYILPS
jgi:hypothetical protein